MDTLLLIPTPLEARQILPEEPQWGEFVTPGPEFRNTRAALCGFGLPMAAAQTGALLARGSFERVLLLGLGGSYDLQAAPPGTLVEASAVMPWGIGAGTGAAHQSAETMGFGLQDGLDLPEDHIPLETMGSTDSARGSIVSVCSATADAEEKQRILRRYPRALVEDMESYGVALCCHLQDIPLHVVRAVANEAGDRDHSRWHADEALEALRLALPELLKPTS